MEAYCQLATGRDLLKFNYTSLQYSSRNLSPPMNIKCKKYTQARIFSILDLDATIKVQSCHMTIIQYIQKLYKKTYQQYDAKYVSVSSTRYFLDRASFDHDMGQIFVAAHLSFFKEPTYVLACLTTMLHCMYYLPTYIWN